MMPPTVAPSTVPAVAEEESSGPWPVIFCSGPGKLVMLLGGGKGAFSTELAMKKDDTSEPAANVCPKRMLKITRMDSVRLRLCSNRAQSVSIAMLMVARPEDLAC
jgi:hypothetical protein